MTSTPPEGAQYSIQELYWKTCVVSDNMFTIKPIVGNFEEQMAINFIFRHFGGGYMKLKEHFFLSLMDSLTTHIKYHFYNSILYFNLPCVPNIMTSSSHILINFTCFSIFFYYYCCCCCNADRFAVD